MAWPAALSLMLNSLYRLNDQAFVQPLGVAAQAAVASCGMVAFLYFAVGELVAAGTLAIGARRRGAGRHQEAERVTRTALRLSATLGIVAGIMTLLLEDWLAAKLIPEADLEERRLFLEYIQVVGLGQVVMAPCYCLNASFLAMRDSRTPLFLQILAICSNALLNWILVPRMGVMGAGIATVGSRAIALVVGVWLLHLHGVRRPLLGQGDLSLVPRMLRIGVPAFIAIALYGTVYLFILNNPLKAFGAEARAVLGVGFALESIFYCLYWGVGTAVAGLVGRGLGAGDLHRVHATVRLALKFNLAIGLGTSVIFWTAATPMVELIANGPANIAASVAYLHVVAWAQPFQAMQCTFDQAMIGAGATRAVSLNSITMNLIRIPLARGLAGGMGLQGVWWAINSSSWAKSVVSVLLYRRGNWQRTEV